MAFPTPAWLRLSLLVALAALVPACGGGGSSGTLPAVLPTQMVKALDTVPVIANANPGNGVVLGSTLFFTANDGVNGNELWKSDGTAAGTVLVKDINNCLALPGTERLLTVLRHAETGAGGGA